MQPSCSWTHTVAPCGAVRRGPEWRRGLGTYGPAAFGGDNLPGPGTVVMQYTGMSEYSPEDPPTFVCVGDRDGITPCQWMKARLEAMSACGIDTEFHCYPGLGHGFGLGTGTPAEGWLDLAVQFWERQIGKTRLSSPHRRFQNCE